MRRIGVLLSGCGVYDGTEIHEAVCILLSIDKESAEAVMLAPNELQMHTIDHVSGNEAADENRNILKESARIARGNIHDVKDATADTLEIRSSSYVIGTCWFVLGTIGFYFTTWASDVVFDVFGLPPMGLFGWLALGLPPMLWLLFAVAGGVGTILRDRWALTRRISARVSIALLVVYVIVVALGVIKPFALRW